MIWSSNAGDDRTLTLQDPDLLTSVGENRVINLGMLYKPRAGENIQVWSQKPFLHVLVVIGVRYNVAAAQWSDSGSDTDVLVVMVKYIFR